MGACQGEGEGGGKRRGKGSGKRGVTCVVSDVLYSAQQKKSKNQSSLRTHLPKILQNLMVSSPAPVHTLSPSGARVMYSTRVVCPVRVATLDMEGKRHTTRVFVE